MNFLDEILGHRIIVVTGKGGTGKTTMAALLGQASARRGLRTVIVEIGGARRIAEIFGRESLGYALQVLEPGLQTLSQSAGPLTEDDIPLLEELQQRYTMMSQRQIHRQVLDGDAAVGGDGLGDNVELF